MCLVLLVDCCFSVVDCLTVFAECCVCSCLLLCDYLLMICSNSSFVFLDHCIAADSLVFCSCDVVVHVLVVTVVLYLIFCGLIVDCCLSVLIVIMRLSVVIFTLLSSLHCNC